MATVKLVLHKSKILKDGTYPLVFQIIHNRRKKIIYTKYKVNMSNFDLARGKVHSCSNYNLSRVLVMSINKDVKQQRKLLMEKIEKLEYLGVEYSVDDINFGASTRNSPYLIQHIKTQINNKLLERKEGTASAYRNTLMSLSKYLDGHDIKVANVTPVFVRKYENYLVCNEVSVNTMSYYMRNLKTLFNVLINDRDYLAENPFKVTRTSICKTVKRALTRKELIKLATLTFDTETESHLEFARDIFMFSYYTRGMPLVDIVYLKKSQLIDDVIVYKRRKTNQQLKVRVTESIRELIAKYDNSSEYILPLLDIESARSLYAQYRLVLGRINHNLKTVGRSANLSVPLTTYMARHSWATQAKESGTPTSVISEGLGHTSEKITQIYLKEFDSSVIDKVNELVTKLK